MDYLYYTMEEDSNRPPSTQLFSNKINMRNTISMCSNSTSSPNNKMLCKQDEWVKMWAVFRCSVFFRLFILRDNVWIIVCSGIRGEWEWQCDKGGDRGVGDGGCVALHYNISGSYIKFFSRFFRGNRHVLYNNIDRLTIAHLVPTKWLKHEYLIVEVTKNSNNIQFLGVFFPN